MGIICFERNTSVLIPKYVAFMTPSRPPRLGAVSAVMLAHHKGTATTPEGA